MNAFIFVIGVVLGCVTAATLIRLVLNPIVPENSLPFMTYFPVLLIATLLGGARAGAFALVASLLLAWWLFVPYRQSFVLASPSSATALIAFAVVGSIIVWGTDRLLARASEEGRLRKVVLERLRTSEERLRLATQSSGVGICDYDVAADVSIWTPESYAITGISPDTTIHFETEQSIIHPEDSDRITKKMRTALDPGGTGQFDEEFRIIRPDNGETRWIHKRFQTLFSGEERRPVGNTGVILDITARKDAEGQAELQRAQLAHMMRVATLAELSGGIAHEVSQPLAAILANAQAGQTLLAAKNHEAVAEILKEIVQDDNRAGEVIHRLRRLLKKGQHRSELIDLNEKIESTVELLHFELVNKKVKVETRLRRDVPLISGDRVQLQQVFINLMMNAIDAMASTPAASRTISIGTRATGDAFVEVSIADHGSGMPPDVLKRLFEPFFTTKERGMGIGLSICSTIIKSHGGRLDLSNSPGGGVTAIVLLPVAVPHEIPVLLEAHAHVHV